MSRSKFELNLDTVRKLSLFVLNSLADQPKEWIAVGKAYQELHGFGDDPIFNQVFVRLNTVMRDEMWVGSPQEGPKFTVGLTFKGQTVIRHPEEIDHVFERHFSKLSRSNLMASAQAEPVKISEKSNHRGKKAGDEKGSSAAKIGGSGLKRTATTGQELEKLVARIEKNEDLVTCLSRLPNEDLVGAKKHYSKKAAKRRSHKNRNYVNFAHRVVREIEKELDKRQKEKRSADRRRSEEDTRKALDKSSEKIRSSLPNLGNVKLLNLWKENTSRAAKSTGQMKNEHLLIVSAVEKEWRRRVRDLPEVEAFKWPNTDVGSGHGGGDFERAEESFLKVLGYTVGNKNGLPASTRQLILDRCFSGHLPPVEGISALRMWGEPKSALRLRKIAYHIAGLAKNFKKMQSRDYEDAISDWEDDLKYMHDKYYVRHFGFSWPGRGL